jgi:hypothetical protein
MAELAVPQFPRGPQDSTFENFRDQRTVDGPDDIRFYVNENVEVCVDDILDKYVLGRIVREDKNLNCFFVSFHDPDDDEGIDTEIRVPRMNPTNIRKINPYVPRPSHVPTGPENPYLVRKNSARDSMRCRKDIY